MVAQEAQENMIVAKMPEVTTDPKTGALYIALKPGAKVVRTRVINSQVMFDIGEDEELVGVEVL